MKNKSFTYIMILVATVVWFVAFKRIKGNLFPETVSIAPPIQPHLSFKSITRDTFDLNADYRDPFGETKKKSIFDETNNTSNFNYTPPPIEVKPSVIEFVWPSIQYLGMVKKTQSSNPLAIITIDGIQLMGRQGEELFNQMYLTAIKRDSVQISYRNKKKYFKR